MHGPELISCLALTGCGFSPVGTAGAASGGPTVGAMAARSAAVTSELADGEGQSTGGTDLPNGFPAEESAKAAESSGRKRDKVKAGLKRITGHKAKASSKYSTSFRYSLPGLLGAASWTRRRLA